MCQQSFDMALLQISVHEKSSLDNDSDSDQDIESKAMKFIFCNIDVF